MRTISPVSDSFTCIAATPQQRLRKPSKHLSGSPMTMVFPSNNITATMVDLLTRVSLLHAKPKANAFPTVESMLISKMTSQRGSKILLHAKVCWPHAIDLALWPYAMRYAIHTHNTVAVIEGKSWIELFSGTDVSSNMKHNHTFGCPVFAL
jgi:hypothetical protein